MQRDEFVDQVQLNILQNHAIRLSDAEAVNAIEAILQTLAEQLSAEARRQLAHTLPPSLGDFWSAAGTARSLTLEGFFQRIAERESIDITVATYYARAVFSTLSEMLSTDDLAKLRAELPARFNSLFERGAGNEIEMSL